MLVAGGNSNAGHFKNEERVFLFKMNIHTSCMVWPKWRIGLGVVSGGLNS